MLNYLYFILNQVDTVRVIHSMEDDTMTTIKYVAILLMLIAIILGIIRIIVIRKYYEDND